jgi:peptidoglycan/LPS O-acetylase OafA/YrhL
MQNPPGPGHFHWIDALRGIAALSIVIFHYHHFYLADALDRSNLPDTTAFPYAALLGPLYMPVGARAVELFWLISGFVFAHVYLPRPVTLWQFSVARFARLYPLHGLLLLVVAALQWTSLSFVGHWQIYGNNDLRHFGLHAVMASNWSTLSHGLSFNGPFWSVSLEILVYALFFVALGLMRRAPRLGSLMLTAMCWSMAEIGNLSLPLVHQAVFACGSYFFLGCTIYSVCFH